MKGVDLFCSSPASTVVISGTHVQRSTVRRTPKSYGLFARAPCSCSSPFPINPKPSYEKHRKSSADKQNHHLRRKSCVQPNDLYTHCSPASSTTHLLADFDASFIHGDDSSALRSSSSPRSRNQALMNQVFLGVTSFSIDMETRKVTIIGDVTPLGVLASVSKVKNAQLWPSPTSLSSSSSMPMVDI